MGRRKLESQILNAFGEDVRREQKCCNADFVELGSCYFYSGGSSQPNMLQRQFYQSMAGKFVAVFYW